MHQLSHTSQQPLEIQRLLANQDRLTASMSQKYASPRLTLKPVALVAGYACYAIGYQWRVANGLPVDQF